MLDSNPGDGWLRLDIVHDVYATSNSGKVRCHGEPLFGAMTVKRATRDGTSRGYIMSRSLPIRPLPAVGESPHRIFKALPDVLTTTRNDGTGRATRGNERYGMAAR